MEQSQSHAIIYTTSFNGVSVYVNFRKNTIRKVGGGQSLGKFKLLLQSLKTCTGICAVGETPSQLVLLQTKH